MAQLHKVHGGDRALCPHSDTFCNTDCAWLIPHFDRHGKIEFYTCCMNNIDRAALMTEEQLERYKERMPRWY